MNKYALNVYVQSQVNSTKSLYGVNWNQLSDRAVPSVLHLCTFKTPTFTCATNNSLIFLFYLTFS